MCPKCGHIPPQALPAAAKCPACGVYLFKFMQQKAAREQASREVEPDAMRLPDAGEVFAALLAPLDKLAPVFFYGRCIALVMLTAWSWKLIGYDYAVGEIGASFMHNILLPIHEAGHIFFTPLGEFMTILGGSLFQILLPLGIGVAFMMKQRDNFGAALGLWWAGISLVDLAPYIYDSLHPRMILLGGHTGEDGPHDWIFLLGKFGQVPNAQHWGAFAHSMGAIVAILSVSWASAVLWKQRSQLSSEHS